MVLEPGFWRLALWAGFGVMSFCFCFYCVPVCVYARVDSAVADRGVVRGNTQGTPLLMTLMCG
jgi:hypothetical protein